MLVISVVVLTVVLAGYRFVPMFRSGVERLGGDVERMLSTGQRGRNAPGAPGAPLGFPSGPGNRGCASGLVCNPRSPSGPLGAPVCRPGDNC